VAAAAITTMVVAMIASSPRAHVIPGAPSTIFIAIRLVVAADIPDAHRAVDIHAGGNTCRQCGEPQCSNCAHQQSAVNQ
jgi:hypothetical protein